MLGLLERNNDKEFISHFQQVRRSPKHDWCWFLTATRIFARDEQGQPLLTLTTSLPVDARERVREDLRRELEGGETSGGAVEIDVDILFASGRK